jgi:succinyl-CoA synthetase alpha subunit
MSILIDKDTRVVVQGMTGEQASFHTKASIEYGTNVVAGVTPGKGGTTHLDRPIFETLAQAVEATDANASMVFVPPWFTADAVLEAIDLELPVVVCVTDGVPVKDMQRLKRELKVGKTRMIGPNCPGMITPGGCRMGIMPGYIHTPGSIGIVSRSGTLSYEAAKQTTQAGLGQTTVVGIGGDQIPGSNFTDILQLFLDDPDTKGIVMLGEIGGTAEVEAAELIRDSKTEKPVVAFIAGQYAPPGRRMGHAGAIVASAQESAAAKIEALKSAGAVVPNSPAEIGRTMYEALSGRS